MDWTHFCSSVTVAEILPKDFTLIHVSESCKIPDLLQIFKTNNISCVPVHDKNMKYIGLVDVSDLASVISLIVESAVEQKLSAADLINQQTLTEIVDFSEQNPWVPIQETASLATVLSLFQKKTNLHRLPVVNAEGNVTGLITQSRVVQFLVEKSSQLPTEITEKPVAEWPTKKDRWRQPVETIQESVLARVAYRFLAKKEISGAAVISSSGLLVGSFSASDIKRSEPEQIATDMSMTVKDYISHPSPRPLVCCKKTDKVLDILNLFATQKIHRIFVVEDALCSTLSLCDVLDLFYCPEIKS